MDNKDNKLVEEKEEEENKKPDETGNILITEFVKIFDPDTGKVYVAKRGDS